MTAEEKTERRRAYQREYQKTEKCRANQRARRRSDKGRAYQRAYQLVYQQSDKGRAAQLKYQQSDKGRAYWRRYKYKLSPEDYKALLQSQGGLCAICRDPPGKMILCVDHDHATGRVRGLLHNTCNAALGHFQDSPDLCRAAAAYLDSHSVAVVY